MKDCKGKCEQKTHIIDCWNGCDGGKIYNDHAVKVICRVCHGEGSVELYAADNYRDYCSHLEDNEQRVRREAQKLRDELFKYKKLVAKLHETAVEGGYLAQMMVCKAALAGEWDMLNLELKK